MTIEPKMNRTEGSMKSLKATSGLRIRNIAWATPMAMPVTPIGNTSKIHQVAARAKTARAPLPSADRVKCLPIGSIASGQGGE